MVLYQNNIPKCVIIFRPDPLRLSSFSGLEEEPGHEVEEDVGEDGGGVTDGGQACSLICTRSLNEQNK
jgi:hypothetical protein